VRRVARKLLIVLAGLSVLLGLVTLGAWVRGYRDMRGVVVEAELDDSPEPGFESATILRCSVDQPGGNAFRFLVWVLDREPRPGVHPQHPVTWERVTWWAWLPLWAVAAATMAPALWLWRLLHRAWVRRARRRAGRCDACGYDLRASPGRCPECGAATPGCAASPV
jgi:hypothetical protein